MVELFRLRQFATTGKYTGIPRTFPSGTLEQLNLKLLPPLHTSHEVHGLVPTVALQDSKLIGFVVNAIGALCVNEIDNGGGLIKLIPKKSSTSNVTTVLLFVPRR